MSVNTDGKKTFNEIIELSSQKALKRWFGRIKCYGFTSYISYVVKNYYELSI